MTQPVLLPLKAARQGMRREDWSFQMNDEQRSMAAFQRQPEGPGPFSSRGGVSFACIEGLHCAHSALLREKWTPATLAESLKTHPS